MKEQSVREHHNAFENVKKRESLDPSNKNGIKQNKIGQWRLLQT